MKKDYREIILKPSAIALVFLIAAACSPAITADTKAVRDRLKNDPFMVPFYTGKILPRPQEVSYGAAFYPLDHVGVITGEGISRDDPRLKLLLNRIVQYGGQYSFIESWNKGCSTIIAVGDTDHAKDMKVPDKPQGYAIRCFERNGKPVVAFNGRDRLGLLWAVNSLVQMITLRDDETVLHAVDVQDFPFMVRRGTKGPGLHRYVEASRIYPVMTKLDWIYFTKSLLVPRRGRPKEWIDWRTPRPKELTDKVAAIGENLRGLGIDWQVGIMPFAIGDTINEQVQVDSKGEEHFDIVWKMCQPVLEAGGGICYQPDDYRFPISTGDMINFGTAREADVYLINRLYRKMKKQYPAATMSLVQPFYHGPRTQNPWSDESPIDYLRALGERLPKDIGIAWTGPMVKTSYFTREQVDKMTALIKRKPYFCQNTADVYPMHIYRYVYPADVMKWWLHTGRDVNVYKQVHGAIFNSLGLYPDMLWSAMLWNPRDFDAEDAAYQATCKLIGPENYDVLRKLVEALSYVDRYYIVRNDKAGLFPSKTAARDIANIESHFFEARKLSKDYHDNSTHPAAVAKLASLTRVLGIIEKFYTELMEDKKYELYRVAVEQEKRARNDVGVGASDVFLAACDWKGGDLGYVTMLLTEDRRPAMTLSGHKPVATAEFKAREDSDGGVFELFLSAKLRGGELESLDILEEASIEELDLSGVAGDDSSVGIYLNGEKVFEGKPPFGVDEWQVEVFALDNIPLKKENKTSLTIKILKDHDKLSLEPVFSINYAIIKKQSSAAD